MRNKNTYLHVHVYPLKVDFSKYLRAFKPVSIENSHKIIRLFVCASSYVC